MGIFLFCAYLISMVLAADGKTSSPPICDCTNPVYIDQPTNIAQCYSKSKFYNQINANYDIVYGFIDQPSAKNCNYTAYRNVVNEMKAVTMETVDAYFKCTKRNCTDAITSARTKYSSVVVPKFAQFVLCSYTYFSAECAVNIKHATYFSFENILTTLTECANLKSSCQRPDFRLLVQELFSKKIPDCNCVKIDQRPIPVSEEQCYSAEYFSELSKWIGDNFSRVKETYRNASLANPQCDYKSFIELTIRAEQTTSQWPSILQNSNPTFEQLKPFFQQISNLATETNTSIRKYILEQEKICYFTPRQLRQSALTISNYVLQILTKCVLYKDPTNSFC